MRTPTGSANPAPSIFKFFFSGAFADPVRVRKSATQLLHFSTEQLDAFQKVLLKDLQKSIETFLLQQKNYKEIFCLKQKSFQRKLPFGFRPIWLLIQISTRRSPFSVLKNEVQSLLPGVEYTCFAMPLQAAMSPPTTGIIENGFWGWGWLQLVFLNEFLFITAKNQYFNGSFVGVLEKIRPYYL